MQLRIRSNARPLPGPTSTRLSVPMWRISCTVRFCNQCTSWAPNSYIFTPTISSRKIVSVAPQIVQAAGLDSGIPGRRGLRAKNNPYARMVTGTPALSRNVGIISAIFLGTAGQSSLACGFSIATRISCCASSRPDDRIGLCSHSHSWCGLLHELRQPDAGRSWRCRW